MKRLKYLIIIAGIILIAPLTLTEDAHATTDYDDIVQTTTSLKVTYDGHSDLDVSNNYLGYFKKIITDDVAQYECRNPSSSDMNDPTWCNQVINDALDHGDWLIGVLDDRYPIYSVSHKEVMGQFCDQKITSISGSTSSNPSFTTRYLMGNTTDPANCLTVRLGYQAYTNGIHLVVGAQGWGDLTTNAIQLGSVLTSGYLGTVNLGYTYLFTSTAPYLSGYEGKIPPVSEPSVRYVAMGDSFSSGEGNPLFEQGSDTSSDSCHRSSEAYPRLLESDNSLDLGRTSFVACSGATTDDVLYGGSGSGNWNEGPQINALTNSTNVVTITIGGNDVGFKDFATACTLAECDFDTTAYADISNKIINNLPEKLENVYDAINDATSSTAQIYVIGYPQITPAEMPTGPSSACYPFNEGSGNPDPTLNDGAAAYRVVAELNTVIHTAVTNMNSSKFHFVDPNLAGSPFIGHDWCQQDRYFDIISYNNLSYSFHPNTAGQAAYKSIVKGALD